ncbi:Tc5 transposase DNA-binding domain [Popillia japonica]|uniref:Tc5 transposase DNA-binding domain n=1 Tax=Popillia japonica TaxID=7064 RepID=A0AAW1L522_POPJA
MMATQQKKNFFKYSENDLAQAISDIRNGNSSIRQAERTYNKYSENDLAQAISDIRNGNSSIRQAERTYNVPHSTLINKLKGRTPETRKMGPATILTQEEEKILVRWINASAKKGFPLNKNLLCETVKDIINSDGRANPFKDGLPGYKWFNAFLNRQPEVSQRHAESINTARASVSETSIRHWHEEIRRYLASENAEDILASENAEDILEDPTRIFNSDESGFATNPKSGLVLGLRGRPYKNL